MKTLNWLALLISVCFLGWLGLEDDIWIVGVMSGSARIGILLFAFAMGIWVAGFMEKD